MVNSAIITGIPKKMITEDGKEVKIIEDEEEPTEIDKTINY